jgi:hypothetical protein
MTHFILTTFGIGLIFSVISVLVERLLIIKGFTRGNTVGLIVASFLLIIFKQLLDYNGSFFYYGLFIIVAGPIGVNRDDLTNTIKKGRWWWLSENKSKDH